MSLSEGFAAWNRGEPRAAHEAFEDAWRQAPPGERRTLLHALAQLGAVGHKVVTGVHAAGARAVLAKARTKLESLPAEVDGVDVRGLLEVADGLEAMLRAETGQPPSPSPRTLPPMASRASSAERALPPAGPGR